MAEPAEPSEGVDLRKEIAGRINRDPVDFWNSNFFQQRLFHALKDPKPQSLTVVMALKPNRVGGSWALMTAWSAIMFGSKNPQFAGISPFGDKFPFLKSGRLVSTSETLGDVGPLQRAMRLLFPLGQYTQSRGVGKGYNSAGKTSNGWDFDMMSYGQDALAAAGSTKGLLMMSEPPPRDLFVECLTRLSGNGLMLIECTQLDLAGWLEDMADDADGAEVKIKLYRETPEGRVWIEDPCEQGLVYGTLKLEGKAVGEVRIVRGDIEDACLEHSNGHMAHSAIQALVAGWPSDEREARSTGRKLSLSGRILPNWGDANEITEPPTDWHVKCWNEGNVRISEVLDPADQKPWALAWFATYPNQDVICFQEWPPFSFSDCKVSPIHDLEDYRNVILEARAMIGKPIDTAIIDPLFGNAPGKGNARTLRQMLSAPCRACLRQAARGDYYDLEEKSELYQAARTACKHKVEYRNGLAYQGSIRDGHILLSAAMGDGRKGVRPKLYAMKDACPNMCRGNRRYAWKLKKNPEVGEKPSIIFKDFPDLERLLYLSRLNEWPEEMPPMQPPPIIKTIPGHKGWGMQGRT